MINPQMLYLMCFICLSDKYGQSFLLIIDLLQPINNKLRNISLL